MQKISIITVTYNCKDVIEDTIKNVLAQDYPNIEYIIVDGASTDGTLEIVNKYKDRISYIISEPDKGVYDAMNKAVKLVSGEWVNFMNAGDGFVADNVISKLFKQDHIGAGVLFGDTLSCDGVKEIPVVYNENHWKHKVMPSCHQSIFVKRNVLLDNPFDLKYKISADVDSFKRMHLKGVVFQYVPILVARYDSSRGISQNPNKYYNELCSIIYGSKIGFFVYLGFRVRFFVGKLLRKFI